MTASGRISTGSERTVLQLKLARALGLTSYPVESATMVTPEGDRIPCYELPVIVTVRGQSAVVVAAVPALAHIPYNLVGADFLRATGARLDCSYQPVRLTFPDSSLRKKSREFRVGGGLYTFRKGKG